MDVYAWGRACQTQWYEAERCEAERYQAQSYERESAMREKVQCLQDHIEAYYLMVKILVAFKILVASR